MWNWAFSKKVFSRAKLLFYYCFFDVLVAVTIVIAQAWFSYVLKIPDDQGFYFLPAFSDFADVSDNCQKSVLDSFDVEFGGKWKVHQKLKFVHKCVIGRLKPNNWESW